MKKYIQIIKKYLPDSLILLGVLTLSYNLLPYHFGFNPLEGIGGYSYRQINSQSNYKLFAIFIITLGIIIVVRRYLESKDKNLK